MRPKHPRPVSAARVAWFVCVFALGCSNASSECRALPAVCPATAPSYANDVAPIFGARCSSCHNVNDPSGPWPFDNHDHISDWRELILQEVATCAMPPPSSGMSFPPEERAIVHAWLVCGAPNN